MLKLVFNGISENAVPVISCTETLRISDEEGTVKEFTAQVSGKTMEELAELAEGLTIEKVEVFSGETPIFESGGYTKLVSVTNCISAMSNSSIFLTLRTV